ncbi:DUF4097 family beta strand repeat-containing protein [Streptomyces sp. NBC_00370]|uniref:DUF4097 family beta strand repeat-containing protein n=1 Tax=Streptomyces sp. NBC_00370 TaxID=2975728 RepID=UPI002E25D3AD
MSKGRTAAIPLGLLAAVGLLAGCGDRHGGVPGDGRGGGQGAAASAATIPAGGRLVIETENGVRLRPTDAHDVSLDGHITAHWSHHDSTSVLDLDCPGQADDGDDGDHNGDGDGDGAGCTRMPTVTVPDGTAVTVSARNAGIDVGGLTGDLHLTTVNGDVTGVETGSAHASVTLTTRNGSIRVTGLRAAHLGAGTVNGDVVLDCAVAPTDVNARTTNGSVDLTVPHDAAPYNVDATTNNGRPHITVPTVPPPPASAKRTLTLRTVNGDVTASPGLGR